MKSAHLIVVGGDVQPGEFHTELPTTIGRGQAATVTISHPLISRLHCKIYERGGHLYVCDLGSLNGTFVNNREVTRDVQLSPGDIISVGGVRLQTANPSDKVPRVSKLAELNVAADEPMQLANPNSHETLAFTSETVSQNSDTVPAAELVEQTRQSREVKQ